MISSSQMAPASLQHGPFLFLSEQFLNFWYVLQDSPSSSSIPTVPALKSAISPRRPASFYEQMVLESKICALGVCRGFLHFEITLQLTGLALWHLLTELWLPGVWGFVLCCDGTSFWVISLPSLPPTPCPKQGTVNCLLGGAEVRTKSRQPPRDLSLSLSLSPLCATGD